MSKRDKVRLGEVATVVSGSTPKTSEEKYWNGEFNWVTPAEIDEQTFYVYETERKITKEAIKDTNLKLLPEGTVLLTSRAPIGKVAIAGSDMYCNQGFKNLICGDRLHNEFLYWFLKSKTEYLNSLGRGATFKEISKAIVEGIVIPFPPIEEQKNIAELLNNVNEFVGRYKKIYGEFDNLIKSIFYEMFGDPVRNDKSWEVYQLKEVIINIKYGASQPPKYTTEGYYFIRATNIKSGRIVTDEFKMMSREESKKFEKCKLSLGDLIIVRSGVNTGDTCVIDENFAGHYAGYDLIISPNPKKVNSIFLNELINTNYMTAIIKPLTRRAAQPHLNAEQVKKLKVIVPPLDLQNQFAEIVAKIEEQKALVKKAIEETQTLFDSLMSKYFDD